MAAVIMEYGSLLLPVSCYEIIGYILYHLASSELLRWATVAVSPVVAVAVVVVGKVRSAHTDRYTQR